MEEKKIPKSDLKDILNKYDYKYRAFFKYTAIKQPYGYAIRKKYSALGKTALIIIFVPALVFYSAKDIVADFKDLVDNFSYVAHFGSVKAGKYF